MTDISARVLLIDAEDRFAEALKGQSALSGSILERVAGEAAALRRLRRTSYDLVITSPKTTVSEDLDLVEEMRMVRPGIKTVILAPEAAPAEVIAALRAHVFAVFAFPHDPAEVAGMARRAIDAWGWRDGIEVLSAQPVWLSVRVQCRLLSAERLVGFLRELRPDVPDEVRDEALLGFREILLNAMEHGGRFDPHQVVEVAAVRTARAVVYYVRDPGHGFRPEAMDHAATGDPAADPIAHVEKRLAQGLRPGGFGILLARNVVDELLYSEKGNEVILVKHLK